MFIVKDTYSICTLLWQNWYPEVFVYSLMLHSYVHTVLYCGWSCINACSCLVTGDRGHHNKLNAVFQIHTWCYIRMHVWWPWTMLFTSQYAVSACAHHHHDVYDIVMWYVQSCILHLKELQCWLTWYILGIVVISCHIKLAMLFILHLLYSYNRKFLVVFFNMWVVKTYICLSIILYISI